MENNLPQGWIESTFGEIADWGSGGTPKSTEPKYYNGGIPWLVIGDLNDGDIYSSEKTISQLGLENSSAKIVPIDSVLCAMYGSIGKLGITKIRCTTNQAIAFTQKIHGGIPFKFVFYFLYSLKNYLLDIGKGGTQANISQTVLKQVQIKIPPLPEQERIIVKLDALFEKFESNKQRLEKIPGILKRFKQSVLAAAVSGKLTEDLREQYGIFEDYCEEVPLGELITSFQNGISKRRSEVGEFTIVLRLADIVDCRINLESTRQIKLNENEVKKYDLCTGDILIIRVNGSPDIVGRFVLVDNDPKVTYCDHFIRIRLDRNKIIPAYLKLITDTSNIRNYIQHNMVSSAGQNTVNQSIIASLTIPLPSLEEQDEIVHRVANLFALVDKITARYMKTKSLLELLVQSTLKKAFTGELVSQNPNDEPASILLERIRIQKEKSEARKS